jgi:hypothetical protein
VSGSAGAANTGGGGGGGGAGGSGGNGGSGIVIVRYESPTTRIELTGSPTITIEAPNTAGAPPATTVVADNARLAWVSAGTNNIEVRRDAAGPALPSGLKLFVQLGSGAPVEVPAGGSWTTLLAATTDTTGDEALTYSVTLDPASDVVATTAVSVDLEYRIGP